MPETSKDVLTSSRHVVWLRNLGHNIASRHDSKKISPLNPSPLTGIQFRHRCTAWAVSQIILHFTYSRGFCLSYNCCFAFCPGGGEGAKIQAMENTAVPHFRGGGGLSTAKHYIETSIRANHNKTYIVDPVGLRCLKNT